MGINGSSYMAGGRNIRDYPGTHAVELVDVDGGETRDKREKFIPAFVVHASTNEVLAAEIENGATPRVSDVMIMNKYPDYFYTDVRGVLGALLSVDPADDSFDWQTAKQKAEDGEYSKKFLAVEVYDSGKTFTSGKKNGQPIHNACYSEAPQG